MRKNKHSSKINSTLQTPHPLGIIDTNVPLIANGSSEQASPQCVISCIHAIKDFKLGLRKLVIDDNWEIISEYRNKLNSDGQPGIGDEFLLWVLTNYTNPAYCELVKLELNETGNYQTFPLHVGLQKFDISDRKFIALSFAHSNTPILQAWDTKWWSLRHALSESGAVIEFLCSNDMTSTRDKLES